MINIKELLMERGIESLGRFYSIYRGMVMDNNDPNHMNSLQVAIPEIQGGIIVWALPFGQHGGLKTGFKYLAPEIGDTVYIMFEYGNPSKPLWTYHGFGLEQIPEELDDPNKMGIITPNGNMVILDETSGELNIFTEGNITIKSNKVIQFQNGSNEGLIKINELTNKLNQTISELEALRSSFNTHTHSGVQTGGGTSAIPLQQITKAFSKYDKNDYEDKNCIH